LLYNEGMKNELHNGVGGNQRRGGWQFGTPSVLVGRAGERVAVGNHTDADPETFSATSSSITTIAGRGNHTAPAVA